MSAYLFDMVSLITDEHLHPHADDFRRRPAQSGYESLTDNPRIRIHAAGNEGGILSSRTA